MKRALQQLNRRSYHLTRPKRSQLQLAGKSPLCGPNQQAAAIPNRNVIRYSIRPPLPELMTLPYDGQGHRISGFHLMQSGRPILLLEGRRPA